MNINNFFNLTIRVQDFNNLATKPDFIKKLRKLTLQPYSGMNSELNHLEHNAKWRKVDCKILTAYLKNELIGWALLSKEPSGFYFPQTNGFHPEDGSLFEIFIHPDHRRKGIASEIIKVARRKAGTSKLCVAPWDTNSKAFFNKFENFKIKKL